MQGVKEEGEKFRNMAHSVQKVVVRCEQAQEEEGHSKGVLGKLINCLLKFLLIPRQQIYLQDRKRTG